MQNHWSGPIKDEKELRWYTKELQSSGRLSCRELTPPVTAAHYFLPTGTNGLCNFLLL